jgi:hypothetical protein
MLLMPELGAWHSQLLKTSCSTESLVRFLNPNLRSPGTVGLYLGVFLVGCSFGSMFTLNVVISSELWGLRHHGERENLCDFFSNIHDGLIERELVCLGANYMLFDGVTSVFGTLGMAKYACTTFSLAKYSTNLHANHQPPMKRTI